MPINDVEAVLAKLKVSDPSAVEIDDLPASGASATLSVASENAARKGEARRRGEYLARSETATAGIDRETAIELRKLGARFVGKIQPDPWPPEAGGA